MSNQAVVTQQPTTSRPVSAPIQAFQGGRSQATQVEQARAIAEVQAAVMVAQDRPRDETLAIAKMRTVCNIMGLAERAFFSFSRGGGSVNGESVHLARELARCWGNIDYGIKELARNDAKGESEMLAFAWDLETNTRNETTFIVPHMRDKKGGPIRITDMRDIYENNANMGARRVRECVFAVLPKWLTDEAAALCRKTLETGGGKPLPQRRADLLAAYEPLGITKAMIEKREGCVVDSLTETQVANLGIVYRSLKSGETTRDEAFPETPADDVTKSLQASVATAAKPAATPVVETKEPDAQPTQGDAAQPHPLGATMKMLVDKVGLCLSERSLTAALGDYAEEMELLRTEAPAFHKQVQAAIDAKRASKK